MAAMATAPPLPYPLLEEPVLVGVMDGLGPSDSAAGHEPDEDHDERAEVDRPDPARGRFRRCRHGAILEGAGDFRGDRLTRLPRADIME